MLLRRAAGGRFICRVKPSSAASAAHLAGNEIAGLALDHPADHRAHRRAVERPLDQVSFPVPRHKAAFDFLGAMEYPQ